MSFFDTLGELAETTIETASDAIGAHGQNLQNQAAHDAVLIKANQATIDIKMAKANAEIKAQQARGELLSNIVYFLIIISTIGAIVTMIKMLRS